MDWNNHNLFGDVFESFHSFKNDAKNVSVWVLRTQNGGETRPCEVMASLPSMHGICWLLQFHPVLISPCYLSIFIPVGFQLPRVATTAVRSAWNWKPKDWIWDLASLMSSHLVGERKWYLSSHITGLLWGLEGKKYMWKVLCKLQGDDDSNTNSWHSESAYHVCQALFWDLDLS